MTDRYNTTIKNENIKKELYDYRKGFSDAKNILKNLYKEGYRDALINMKKRVKVVIKLGKDIKKTIKNTINLRKNVLLFETTNKFLLIIFYIL